MNASSSWRYTYLLVCRREMDGCRREEVSFVRLIDWIRKYLMLEIDYLRWDVADYYVATFQGCHLADDLIASCSKQCGQTLSFLSSSPTHILFHTVS